MVCFTSWSTVVSCNFFLKILPRVFLVKLARQNNRNSLKRCSIIGWEMLLHSRPLLLAQLILAVNFRISPIWFMFYSWNYTFWEFTAPQNGLLYQKIDTIKRTLGSSSTTMGGSACWIFSTWHAQLLRKSSATVHHILNKMQILNKIEKPSLWAKNDEL